MKHVGSLWVAVITAIIWLVLSYSLVFVVDNDTAIRLTTEDGLIENLGAIFFFAASSFYCLALRRPSKVTKPSGVMFRRNVFLALLALGFFFVTMEEISWGQRVFGFKTPEAYKEFNTQNELNIHNLVGLSSETGLSHWFNIQRLFSLFWLTYCVVIPVLYRYNAGLQRFLKRTGLPIVPICIGCLFLLNFAVAKFIALGFIPSGLIGAVTETKDWTFAK